MTMVLEGPFPGIQTVLLLPNPVLDNSKSLDVAINYTQSISGSRYTYVKTSGRKRLSFTWEVLGRGKLVELQEFYKAYAGQHVRLTDFRDNTWDVILEDEPSITIDVRSANAGATRRESGSVTLELNGAPIT